jgi:hypothetical protein
VLLAARPEYVGEAERLLRDPSHFEWSVVLLLAIVFYLYTVEVERRRFDVLAAGLAVWLADWLNEILNSLVLHVSDRAPLWAETGETSYQFLIGLNIETSLFFAVFGLVYAKSLPVDRGKRILGTPNRLAIALAYSLIAVAIEVVLNDWGYLNWDYWWWSWPFVPLIVIFGYLWFFLFAAYVYDRATNRERFRALALLAGLIVALAVVFGPVVGWL